MRDDSTLRESSGETLFFITVAQNSRCRVLVPHDMWMIQDVAEFASPMMDSQLFWPRRVVNIVNFFIPECVARVPASLWGSGGWGCVRSTLRLRSQPSAPVRGRSFEARMAVPMASSAKGVTFGGFERRVPSFRVAGGTLWHSNMFHKASKVILCDRCNTLCVVFRRWVACFVAGAALWRSPSSFCVDVVLRDVARLSANCNVRAAWSSDNVQIPWQAWHFVRCDENWRKPRTKHRFWGSKFWGSWENL